MVDTARHTATTERDLVITRVFEAPRELVFRAWTDPAQFAAWWGPQGFSAPFAEMDVVPGGAWRSCIRREADQTEIWSRGVYREVVPPQRLVFTFAWETADGAAGHETLVTVTFDDLGGRTRMTFRQGTFTTVEERDEHEGGWSECFAKLADLLAGRDPAPVR